MTPLFAYLLGLAVVIGLGAGAWILEETEAGRRFTARAIDWIVR